jgi:hypothetical protein
MTVTKSVKESTAKLLKLAGTHGRHLNLEGLPKPIVSPELQRYKILNHKVTFHGITVSWSSSCIGYRTYGLRGNLGDLLQALHSRKEELREELRLLDEADIMIREDALSTLDPK